MNLQQFTKLKEQVDQLQRESDRAAGALQQLKYRIKTEFGCKTIKEARILLKRLRQQAETGDREFQTALKAFEKEYAERLSQGSR